LGLLNIAAIKASISSIFNFCIFSNIISTIYFILIVIALPEPQALIGIVFILCVLVGSISIRTKLVSQ
jgi:hypothetical protein